ncbi:MAG: DUF748 domain-containing protein [Gammaproteobacteria bacterium]|nr:DUF748 domain-containing protein [Gammaproteobacteria bacterium]
MSDTINAQPNDQISSEDPSVKNFSRLKSVFVIVVSVILLIYLLIWAFSPKLTHFYINDYLQSHHQLDLSEKTSVRYNPFTSHLSVHDLSVINGQETVISLNNLEIEIRLHQLLRKNLYASEFKLENLAISVIKTTDVFQIAGLDINKLVSESETTAATNPDEETTAFQLVLPRLSIHNSEINLGLNGQKHHIAIKQLSITQSKLSSRELDINLGLEANVDGAPFVFSADSILKRGIGKINFKSSLKNYDVAELVQFLPQEINQLAGKIGFESEGEVNLSENKTALLMPAMRIELADSQLLYNDLELTHQSLNMNLSGLNLHLLENSFITAAVKAIEILGGSLKSTGSGVTLGSDKQQIISDNFSVSMDDSAGINLRLGELQFEASDLTVLMDNFDVEIETAEVAIKETKSTYSESLPLAISMSGDIQIDSFSSYNPARTALIAGIESIHMDDFSIEKSQSVNFAFNELSFLGNEFSNYVDSNPTEKEDLPALLTADAIRIQSFLQNKQQIIIDTIFVDGLNSHIYLGKNALPDNLVNLDFLELEKELTEEEQLFQGEKDSLQASTTDDETLPLVKINEIAVMNTQSIKIVDTNVTPVYERQIRIDKLSLENIDANFPENESLFIFTGSSDKYTKYNFKGYVKPFTEKTNLSLSGTLTEVSLPPINAYLHQMLGLDVASGELDLAPTVVVKDSIITGNTKINIRGLELESNKKYQSNNLKSETALPLNTALGMLQDDKGNLELAVPMQGNVDNPDFGLSGFLTLITTKAIYSATQSYLIKAFLPYGELLSIAFSAGKYVMKTRFEDLHYVPMQTTISEQQQPYIEQFISLMQSKTEIQVKVCATATLVDIPVDNPEVKTQEDKISFLENVANLRMTNFKERVLTQGIDSARILLCSPKVDLDKKSKPKIMISI